MKGVVHKLWHHLLTAMSTGATAASFCLILDDSLLLFRKRLTMDEAIPAMSVNVRRRTCFLS